MTSEVHDHVRDRLTRTRQRYTDGRRDLVDLLLDIDRPLTIPELLDRGVGQSQSSLYRNLAVLEQCDVVRRLSSVDDAARYELTEDLTEHHHHVVCTRCGRLDDVVLPPEVERQLHVAVDHVATALDYEVAEHHVELVGTCPDCRGQ